MRGVAPAPRPQRPGAGGPGSREQAVLALRADTGGGCDSRAQQMQLAPSPRGRHVQQALAFLIKADLPLFANPFIQRFGIFTVQPDRRDKEFVFPRPWVDALQRADQRVGIARTTAGRDPGRRPHRSPGLWPCESSSAGRRLARSPQDPVAQTGDRTPHRSSPSTPPARRALQRPATKRKPARSRGRRRRGTPGRPEFARCARSRGERGRFGCASADPGTAAKSPWWREPRPAVLEQQGDDLDEFKNRAIPEGGIVRAGEEVQVRQRAARTTGHAARRARRCGPWDAAARALTRAGREAPGARKGVRSRPREMECPADGAAARSAQDDCAREPGWRPDIRPRYRAHGESAADAVRRC